MDEKLIAKIKEVFANYDDGQSENGWAALQVEHKATPNTKLHFWQIIGTAAAVVIVFGLLFFLNNTPKQSLVKQIVKKNSIKLDVKTGTALAILKKEIVITKSKTVNELKYYVKNKAINALKNNTKVIEVDKKQLNVNTKKQSRTYEIKTLITENKKEPIITIVNKPDTVNEIINNNNYNVATVVTNKPAEIKNNNATIVDIDKPLEIKNNKQITEAILAERRKLPIGNNTKKMLTNQIIKNSIDIFTGSFVNYYDNNEAKVNTGFGLNANVKLSKNIIFSFGAGVSQNKISYSNNLPKTASGFAGTNGAAPAGQVGAGGIGVGSSGGGVITTPSITDVSVNAQLLNLDIPISLKFYPSTKQNFYISAGVNSNSYLAQNYTYNYSFSSAPGVFASTKQTEETQDRRLKGFDLANSAILAIGINQNIGKTTSLVFEPYFKPIIGTMGDKKLKINAVGLNLKFNFFKNNKKE